MERIQGIHKAQVQNPALDELGKLVGEWETVGTHPELPGKVFAGKASFQWIEGGAFLRWYSEVDEEGFPVGIAIFSSDDATGELFMLTFDERKVSRKYDVSVEDNVVRWWRNAPNLSQRYTWIIADDGNTIIEKGELSKEGTTWEEDLEQTFTRIR
ncbi:hypothetical protein [Fibrella aquatilis]|uniref:DUF1579 domain-containing protein n=1 Tax=Fibrella aquatilis TaxID=2817059 RepID=A0A939K2E8_9BACT|nr:hypothetical protein [Fibrella aquatilis]MBO0933235.1 hypothetical protein [Fibrella aquatilis]